MEAHSAASSPPTAPRLCTAAARTSGSASLQRIARSFSRESPLSTRRRGALPPTRGRSGADRGEAGEAGERSASGDARAGQLPRRGSRLRSAGRERGPSPPARRRPRRASSPPRLPPPRRWRLAAPPRPRRRRDRGGRRGPGAPPPVARRRGRRRPSAGLDGGAGCGCRAASRRGARGRQRRSRTGRPRSQTRSRGRGRGHRPRRGGRTRRCSFGVSVLTHSRDVSFIGTVGHVLERSAACATCGAPPTSRRCG